jgi:hypothetical protein
MTNSTSFCHEYLFTVAFLSSGEAFEALCNILLQLLSGFLRTKRHHSQRTSFPKLTIIK